MMKGLEFMVLAVLFLINRVAGEVHAKLLHGSGINRGQDYRGVCITALQLRNLTEGSGSLLAFRSGNRKRNQDFIGMQPGIFAAEIGGF